jgi:hypothetical protein
MQFPLSLSGARPGNVFYAAIAHLVERHLAKVEVASSSLVGRSNVRNCLHCSMRRKRRISAIQAISSLSEQNHEFCSGRARDEGRKSGVSRIPVPSSPFPVSQFPRIPASPFSSLPLSPFPKSKPSEAGLIWSRSESQRWKPRPARERRNRPGRATFWRHSQVVRHGTANP